MSDDYEETRNTGNKQTKTQSGGCRCADNDATAVELSPEEAALWDAADEILEDTETEDTGAQDGNAGGNAGGNAQASGAVELEEAGFDAATYGGGSLERVPGFNFTEAMLDGIGTIEESALPEGWSTMRDAADAHYGGDITAESVCGQDDRTRVDTVTAPPWRMIAKLLITAGDGGKYVGTGWFIAPRTLVTAGHCVFSNRTGGWAKSIQVVPGMNGRNRPFGTASSATFRSVSGWTQGAKPAFDYGAIILPKSAPLGDKVGYFGFSALKSATLRNLLVNTSGYPADKSVGTQWYNGGRITNVQRNQFDYMIDTFGGQSGSPVWKYSHSTGTRQVVGIHNYGGCANKASRITKEAYQVISNWKTEGA